jgi:PAS domain S-box-containing protein
MSTAGTAFDLDHADSVALLDRQTEMLERIAAGAALSEILTGIATALEELVPGSRCSVLLLDAVFGTLHHGAAPSLPTVYSAGIDGLSIGENAGSCGTAAYLERPVVAEDITTDPRWEEFRALATPHGLRSCWSSPILGRTGVLGTFAVYHDRTHRPSPREERLVERLTHLASVAIDHSGLYGALSESEERFRRAFEDSATGMALTTVDGVTTRVNHALRELFDRPDDTILGRPLEELLTRVADTGPVGDGTSYEARAWRPDGSELELAVAESEVRGADGEPVYLSVNVLDLTQRRAAQRERLARHEAEVARSAAEAASRAKSDFVSALGHELRTPLQAITGFTELLGTLNLPAERAVAAREHIAGAAQHILSLVDDVLDVARIEEGALPMSIVDVGTDGAVGEVLDLLSPLAHERSVELARSGPSLAVLADERRLRQVLINLVGNGVRYNRPGGRVDVTCAAVGGSVAVTVADTGRGIHADRLGRLFVPFDRLEADDEADPGVGLGLPLARGLVEAMNGTLEVTSEIGVGTTVVLTLPHSPAD